MRFTIFINIYDDGMGHIKINTCGLKGFKRDVYLPTHELFSSVLTNC